MLLAVTEPTSRLRRYDLPRDKRLITVPNATPNPSVAITFTLTGPLNAITGQTISSSSGAAFTITAGSGSGAATLIISVTAGVNDAAHFSRTFRFHFGIAPSQLVHLQFAGGPAR